MSKLELKKLDYDGYVYYNGKRCDDNEKAMQIKKKKVDYYVLLEDDKFFSEFCVTKDDNKVPFKYFEESFNKDPEFVFSELAKRYGKIKLFDVSLHITEHEEILNYIKEHYNVLGENVEKKEEYFENGKKLTYVSLAIELK